ncbi:MAG: BMP family ABC transporter substrate-binding protein [Candidatus Lustribacter sp.]
MISRRALVLGGTALFGVAAAACSHPKGIAQGGNVRLAMVTDTGGLGDQSFNDGAYRGLLDAKRDLHADIAVLQSRSAADYQPNLTVLANKEYDEIFAVGFLMAQDVDEVASRFPSRNFAIIDAVVAEPNVASITFREQEGSFLAGVAAAYASKTKTIAFVGGIDIPLLRKFEAGYTVGARQIDPAIDVLVKYVGSFDDPAAGKEIAGVLLSQNADVIYVAAGKAGLGAIDQIKTHPGTYAIGVDVDQDALAPGKILTSMVKRVDVGVLTVSRIAATGKVPHGHIELGLKQGAIGLTDFKYTRSALTPAQFHEIDVLRSAIITGRIVPPTTREELATWKPVKL